MSRLSFLTLSWSVAGTPYSSRAPAANCAVPVAGSVITGSWISSMNGSPLVSAGRLKLGFFFQRLEKESRQIFDRLVEKGRRVETRQFKAIDRTVARTSERVSELSERLQCRIESGTRGLLERLGLPTRDDLEKLSGRISTLSKSVERIAAERR
jgi:polyhydroxyalkanoate synthesis regulator phasin